MVEAIRKLDGFAACNLAEPSEGDLERIYTAYRECFEKYMGLKAEADKLAECLKSCHACWESGDDIHPVDQALPRWKEFTDGK